MHCQIKNDNDTEASKDYTSDLTKFSEAVLRASLPRLCVNGGADRVAYVGLLMHGMATPSELPEYLSSQKGSSKKGKKKRRSSSQRKGRDKKKRKNSHSEEDSSERSNGRKRKQRTKRSKRSKEETSEEESARCSGEARQRSRYAGAVPKATVEVARLKLRREA